VVGKTQNVVQDELRKVRVTLVPQESRLDLISAWRTLYKMDTHPLPSIGHVTACTIDEFQRTSGARRESKRETDGCSSHHNEPRLEHISAWRKRNEKAEEAISPASTVSAIASSAEGYLPKIPCLAVTIDASHNGCAHILHSSGIGRAMTIKPGTHAFVALQQDTFDKKPFFRVTLMSFAFGSSCGHPNLANEQDVLFAGEIEFGSEERIIRWNNLSGTYHAPEELANQAGLPMDMFWAFRKTLKRPRKETCKLKVLREDEEMAEGEEMKQGNEGVAKMVLHGQAAWLVRVCKT
jgi:hypothetical protein